MKFDKNSPLYLVYVAVTAAVLVLIMQLIFDDGIDWVMVVILSVAVTVGAAIGQYISKRRAA